MRMLLKFELGLAATNTAVRDGSIDEINKRLIASTNPEAAYFGTENGRRTGYIVFDMIDSAQIAPSRCSSRPSRPSRSSP